MTSTAPSVYPRRDKADGLHPLDPSGWDVKEWSLIGGLVATAFVWMWRKLCWPSMRYLILLGKLPVSVEAVRSAQDRMSHEIYMANSRSRALLDSLPRPVWESDEFGNCVFANATMWRDLLGRAFSEFEGNRWPSIVAPEDRQRVVEEWAACVKDGRDFYMEYSWMDHKGNRVPIKATGHCVRNGDKVIGWRGEAIVVHHYQE